MPTRLTRSTQAIWSMGTPSATDRTVTSRRQVRAFGGVGIAMVYASFTPETALAETLAQNRYYGIPIEDTMPRTFVAVAVKLTTLLDLRSGAIRRRLQVSADALT